MTLENINKETDCNGVEFKIGDKVKEIYYSFQVKKYHMFVKEIVGFNKYGGVYIVPEGRTYSPNLHISTNMLEIISK
jgi:hypothetical protein